MRFRTDVCSLLLLAGCLWGRLLRIINSNGLNRAYFHAICGMLVCGAEIERKRDTRDYIWSAQVNVFAIRLQSTVGILFYAPRVRLVCMCISGLLCTASSGDRLSRFALVALQLLLSLSLFRSRIYCEEFPQNSPAELQIDIYGILSERLTVLLYILW